MEHFELVEKLVNTFGVNYEEAENALEQSGWDPVEAAVILERAKNSTPEKEAPKVKNAARESFESCQNTVKEEGSKLFKTVWDFLSLNEFVVKKSSGEIFLNLPLWISILLLCAFFCAAAHAALTALGAPAFSPGSAVRFFSLGARAMSSSSSLGFSSGFAS